jgi:hypothetical protein
MIEWFRDAIVRFDPAGVCCVFDVDGPRSSTDLIGSTSCLFIVLHDA